MVSFRTGRSAEQLTLCIAFRRQSFYLIRGLLVAPLMGVVEKLQLLLQSSILRTLLLDDHICCYSLVSLCNYTFNITTPRQAPLYLPDTSSCVTS